MKLFSIIILAIFLLLSGCSASTGSRYETEEKKEETGKIEVSEEKEIIEEELDTFPYTETFEFENTPSDPIGNEDLDLWFTYDDKDTSVINDSREVVDQTDGYRVQIIVTDNIEEANQIRSEIYFKTNQKSVYITFEPPFYKVKAGDFTQINEARDFNFKLNQMGYKETKVVSEKVNVFK